MARAKKCLKKMKFWAKNSPTSHLHRLLHLEAEFAAYEGRIALCQQKLDEAISDAASNGCLWGQAVICERAANILREAGLQVGSLDYLRRARDAYEIWGSMPKADALYVQLGADQS